MKIGVIGGGNMGGALVSGLLASGAVQCGDILISDRSADCLNKWREKGLAVTEQNREAEAFADLVLLAVKPNVMGAVLQELAGEKDKIYLSIAAGISLAYLEQFLGTDAKIVRAMPNTPAMVGCGMTVLSPNTMVSDGDLQAVQTVLGAVGEIALLDEAYMNAACALHGSSPAYIYMLIEAMADSGVKYGIPKAVARKLAAKAVEGSAKMVLSGSGHPAELKDQVCSPGGTTIAAVCELEKTGFCAAVQAGIDACVQRAEEMSK